jgi:hypothetical protein
MKKIKHGGHGGIQTGNMLQVTAFPRRTPICITAVIAVVRLQLFIA